MKKTPSSAVTAIVNGLAFELKRNLSCAISLTSAGSGSGASRSR